jgi:predicted transcriptional regulator
MTQNPTPTTALLETSRALIEAQRELIPLLGERVKLVDQFEELTHEIELAKDKVAALTEARKVLSSYFDDDADADAYFKAQGEAYRDEDYASLARDEAYASGAWSS